MEKLQLEMKATIDATGCLEAVQLGSRNGDIRVLCRCVNKPKWLTVLYEYLGKEAAETGYYSFIGQKYMLMNNNLTAAWVVMLQGDDLDGSVQKFRDLLSAASRRVNEQSNLQSVQPGHPQTGEPKEYTVPLPYNTGFGEKLQARVQSLNTRTQS
jgi:hypothetical protein